MLVGGCCWFMSVIAVCWLVVVAVGCWLVLVCVLAGVVVGCRRLLFVADIGCCWLMLVGGSSSSLFGWFAVGCFWS